MYLMDRYDGPQAGTEGQLLQLVRHLDRSRYEPAVTLLRGSDRGGFDQRVCPVAVLGITRLLSIRSILRFLGFALRLRRESYRVVHCFLNDVSLIGPPLLRVLGIRVLVSRRDMGFWYSRWNLAVLRIARVFVDRYVTNSQAVRQVVHEREWVPCEKISVIYNGFAPQAQWRGGAANTEPRPTAADRAPVVGIVANLRPIKRIDVLVQAFALVCGRYPGARLMVVGGDGPSLHGASMREELERLASRLEIGDRLLFTGRVDDPAPYIRQFSVAVLCSDSEGFSNAVIEYMHAGRAVVCTDTGGNPELVQDGRNGFLVPVGDVEALADRLLRLLSDSALASRLGEAARETVASAYSPTRMVSEHMACYDDVLAVGQFSLSLKPASGKMHRRWAGAREFDEKARASREKR